MNIIAVDDEAYALATLCEAICEALPNETPVCFSNSEAVLRHAKETTVDVAFLDIKMNDMDGISLAKALKAIRPTTNIIFVTGSLDYMQDALALYASGYVKKPVRTSRILREIANLRHPPDENATPKKIRTLGPYMFDHVTQRVYFDRRDALLKPREFHLFCLFANNPGVFFTAEALFRQIWGEEPNDSTVNTVRVHLSSLRKKLNMSDNSAFAIKKKRGEGYYLELEAE